MSFIILLRGGGDLASGVALRLHRAGLRVAITELPQPLAVRRKVAFAEAVYSKEVTVEGVTARRVSDFSDTLAILRVFSQGQIPVLVDPEAASLKNLRPTVLVDARMTKKPSELGRHAAALVIGLGPGFVAGENCHAVVETKRGHSLGRVIWEGAPAADTGAPDHVQERGLERVLRAPVQGVLQARADLGDQLEAGQLVATVGQESVIAPFKGVLRGLVKSGLEVPAGVKIGDLDPRNDPALCDLVSDKALAVAGGVMEALLARREFRPQLWT
jgi:xanthine dehydrogenase accessory factor